MYIYIIKICKYFSIANKWKESICFIVELKQLQLLRGLAHVKSDHPLSSAIRKGQRSRRNIRLEFKACAVPT